MIFGFTRLGASKCEVDTETAKICSGEYSRRLLKSRPSHWVHWVATNTLKETGQNFKKKLVFSVSRTVHWVTVPRRTNMVTQTRIHPRNYRYLPQKQICAFAKFLALSVSVPLQNICTLHDRDVVICLEFTKSPLNLPEKSMQRPGNLLLWHVSSATSTKLAVGPDTNEQFRTWAQ